MEVSTFGECSAAEDEVLFEGGVGEVGGVTDFAIGERKFFFKGGVLEVEGAGDDGVPDVDFNLEADGFLIHSAGMVRATSSFKSTSSP